MTFSKAIIFVRGFPFRAFRPFGGCIFCCQSTPQVFEETAPERNIRAIIAHAAYYRRHNRFELLGLINLQSKSFTARFERGADLQAIRRGYGAVLKDYREWLYRNIPPAKIKAKKRDYFSPGEIDLIVEAIKEKPDLIDYWIKKSREIWLKFNRLSTAK